MGQLPLIMVSAFVGVVSGPDRPGGRGAEAARSREPSPGGSGGGTRDLPGLREVGHRRDATAPQPTPGPGRADFRRELSKRTQRTQGRDATEGKARIDLGESADKPEAIQPVLGDAARGVGQGHRSGASGAGVDEVVEVAAEDAAGELAGAAGHSGTPAEDGVVTRWGSPTAVPVEAQPPTVAEGPDVTPEVQGDGRVDVTSWAASRALAGVMYGNLEGAASLADGDGVDASLSAGLALPRGSVVAGGAATMPGSEGGAAAAAAGRRTPPVDAGGGGEAGAGGDRHAAAARAVPTGGADTADPAPSEEAVAEGSVTGVRLGRWQTLNQVKPWTDARAGSGARGELGRADGDAGGVEPARSVGAVAGLPGLTGGVRATGEVGLQALSTEVKALPTAAGAVTTEAGAVTTEAGGVPTAASKPDAVNSVVGMGGAANAGSPTVQPSAGPTPLSYAPELRFYTANAGGILQAVRTQLMPNGGTMTMRLDPPEMGALQVAVVMKDGKASVTFRAENPEAVRLLSQTMSQLRETLGAAGLTVDRMQVQQGHRQEGSGPGGDRGSQGQPGQGGLGGFEMQEEQARREQQRRELLERLWEKAAGVDSGVMA